MWLAYRSLQESSYRILPVLHPSTKILSLPPFYHAHTNDHSSTDKYIDSQRFSAIETPGTDMLMGIYMFFVWRFSMTVVHCVV